MQAASPPHKVYHSSPAMDDGDASKSDMPFTADVDRARKYLYGRQRE